MDANGRFAARPRRPLPAGSYTARLHELDDSGERVGEERSYQFVRWSLGSRSSKTGRLVGARPGQPGPLGRRATAVAFDGTDDFAVVPDSDALDARRGVTVGAWIRRRDSGRWQALVGKPGDGRSKLENYGLWLNESDHAVAFFGDGERYLRVETPAPLDDDWHSLVATYDRARAVLYLDGIRVATTPGRIELTPNDGALNIARARDGTSFFKGGLDLVAVLPRTLRASEVKDLHLSAVTDDVKPPHLTLTTPAPGTTTADSRPVFAGSAASTVLDAQRVVVGVWRGPKAGARPVLLTRAARLPSGVWSARSPRALTPGVYTARAEQRDVAGNLGASRPTTFRVRAAPQGGRLRTILAAGDIADCSSDGDDQTARLLDRLPGLVVTLGDHAYDWGTTKDFAECYAPSWGRHRSRTRPVLGGHEYGEGGGDASAYFRYFHAQLAPYGPSATDPRRGWYSYDYGGWHVVVLNTSWREVGLPKADSEQTRWLRADLRAHPTLCTLALWHDPVFSSGFNGGSFSYRPLWDALYAAGAELVLNGHDHDYERFAPQDPGGAYDPVRGIRQIVVGTGGFSHYSFEDGNGILANSEVRDDRTFGVLRLTLRPRGYEWEFLSANGGSFTDAGSARCH